MKMCSKCNIKKSLDDFCNKKDNKDGKHIYCKECRSNNSKNEYNNSKDKFQEYYIKNRDIKLDYQKQYNQQNKEIQQTYQKQYAIDNKEYFINYKRKYRKFQYDNNIHFKLSSILRSRLNQALKNKLKINTTIKLLGCSVNQLKQHLECKFKNEMNWSNHGVVWEIDHIRPCASFDLSDIEQQKQCFHYSNLQPLFKTTEISNQLGYTEKGNRNKSKEKI
jgi:hypothetical protein